MGVQFPVFMIVATWHGTDDTLTFENPFVLKARRGDETVDFVPLFTASEDVRQRVRQCVTIHDYDKGTVLTIQNIRSLYRAVQGINPAQATHVAFDPKPEFVESHQLMEIPSLLASLESLMT